MVDVFVVSVEGNLVTAIERTAPTSAEPPGTPLEIGTQLATNFRETGRLDGSYVFASADGARSFAVLCLQFVKNLVEQRCRLIEGLPAGFDSYRAEPQPGGCPEADNRS